ncbi:MAG: DUF421 domain-containing protein [Clostridia bacterium]|nr:DUF421 domain-containing protein [Clostridia bacterium]
MAVSLIRSVILYLLVVSVYRLMGKRQIGELQPSELVLAIMISDVASVPMQSATTPLVSGIVPVLTLMFIEVSPSFIAQKSEKLRKVITGAPSLIIAEGKLQVKEMEKLRFNIDDLIEQLRNNGYFDVGEIAFAVLETNGNLSIMPKEEHRPVTIKDLNVNKGKAEFTFNIIKDGVLDKDALKKLGHDEAWVNSEIKKHKISSIKKVFLLCADKNGVTFIQRKEFKK